MMVHIPPWKGAIVRGRGVPLLSIGNSTVISAKMAESIEMPFGLRARMGPRSHVYGGPKVLMDVAMATIFWLSMG